MITPSLPSILMSNTIAQAQLNYPADCIPVTSLAISAPGPGITMMKKER